MLRRHHDWHYSSDDWPINEHYIMFPRASKTHYTSLAFKFQMLFIIRFYSWCIIAHYQLKTQRNMGYSMRNVRYRNNSS